MKAVQVHKINLSIQLYIYRDLLIRGPVDFLSACDIVD